MFESEEVKLAREALNQSREELRSAKASYKELKKYYRVSKINAGKSFVTRVHNSIINYFKEQVKEQLQEQERVANRKADMKAALREKNKEKIKTRFLNIKSGFASKIQVTKSYMGELKNKALENAVIYGKNIDKVTRELVDKGKIFGLTKTYQIKQNIDNAKERYNSYKINRMVKSELKRIAKEETKEEERSQKRREEIERLSEEKRKLERAQNKKAMIYALNQRDREEFDKRHLESLQQIEELKKAIFNKNSSSRSR